MNKKNLLSILMITLFTLILLTGCDFIMKKDVPASEFVNPVSLEEVVKKIENEETFNFILGNESCPACAYYKEELIKFHKTENYKFDYLNYDANTDMDLMFKLMTEMLEQKIEEIATPTTYFIVDGQLQEKIVGAIKAEEIMSYSKYYK